MKKEKKEKERERMKINPSSSVTGKVNVSKKKDPVSEVKLVDISVKFTGRLLLDLLKRGRYGS